MFVGIDVAKAELVASSLPAMERFTVANEERGVRTLVERLRAVAPTLVVLEATGGYELLGVAALVAAGLPVVVVNPRQVRDFAKATGQRRRTASTPISWRASPTWSRACRVWVPNSRARCSRTCRSWAGSRVVRSRSSSASPR